MVAAGQPQWGYRSIGIRTYDATTGVYTVRYANGATATRTNVDLSPIMLNTMMLGASPNYSGGPSVGAIQFNTLVIFNGVLTTAQQDDLFTYTSPRWSG
jgi:hypothetical protein